MLLPFSLISCVVWLWRLDEVVFLYLKDQTIRRTIQPSPSPRSHALKSFLGESKPHQTPPSSLISFSRAPEKLPGLPAPPSLFSSSLSSSRWTASSSLTTSNFSRLASSALLLSDRRFISWFRFWFSDIEFSLIENSVILFLGFLIAIILWSVVVPF